MAKYSGIIDLTGTINGVTHTRHRKTKVARRKSSLTAERVKTDPAFKDFMAAAGAFGDAAKMSAWIRYAFDPYREELGDGTEHHRLTKIINARLRPKSHAPKPKPSAKKRIVPLADQRWISDRPVEPIPEDESQFKTPWGRFARVLAGFKFNEEKPLRRYLSGSLGFTLDDNTFQVSIPAIDPNCTDYAKNGATHIQVIAILASLTPETPSPDYYLSDPIPIPDKRGLLTPRDPHLFTHTFRLQTPQVPTAYLLALGLQGVQIYRDHPAKLYSIQSMDILHLFEHLPETS